METDVTRQEADIAVAEITALASYLTPTHEEPYGTVRGWHRTSFLLADSETDEVLIDVGERRSEGGDLVFDVLHLYKRYFGTTLVYRVPGAPLEIARLMDKAISKMVGEGVSPVVSGTGNLG